MRENICAIRVCDNAPEIRTPYRMVSNIAWSEYMRLSRSPPKRQAVRQRTRRRSNEPMLETMAEIACDTKQRHRKRVAVVWIRCFQPALGRENPFRCGQKITSCCRIEAGALPNGFSGKHVCNNARRWLMWRIRCTAANVGCSDFRSIRTCTCDLPSPAADARV